MQLSPNESFILARQLEDSSDSNTYYVRAVVKDSANTTLDTINLTDRGSQFFSKSYTVPADTTGNGRWITIQTSVYTDAAYSTLSTLYGTRLDTYLVQTRSNANLHLGGGGADISYKKVREIVQEEIGKIQFPDIPKTNLSPLQTKLSELEIQIKDKIENISLDTSPIEKRLGNVEKSVKQAIKDIPQTDIDLEPAMQEIDSLKTLISSIDLNSFSKEHDMVWKLVQDTNIEVSKKIKALEDSLEELKVKIPGPKYVFVKGKPQETQAPPEKIPSFKELLGI